MAGSDRVLPLALCCYTAGSTLFHLYSRSQPSCALWGYTYWRTLRRVVLGARSFLLLFTGASAAGPAPHEHTRGKQLFKYREATQAHALQCDRCGTQELITTTADPLKARQIAERWRWLFDTPLGDLCPRCAGVWRAGVLDAEVAPPRVDDAEQTPSAHPTLSHKVNTLWKRGHGSFRRLFLF